MNLLIDIGNSNSKIAITKDYTIIKEINSSSKLIEKIKELFSNYKITHSSMSNVSDTESELIDFLKKNSCFFDLKKNNHLPFKNPYKEGLVGDDRLALVCAAHKDYPNENVLFIDIGTCITYDIKTKNNLTTFDRYLARDPESIEYLDGDFLVSKLNENTVSEIIALKNKE